MIYFMFIFQSNLALQDFKNDYKATIDYFKEIFNLLRKDKGHGKILYFFINSNQEN